LQYARCRSSFSTVLAVLAVLAVIATACGGGSSKSASSGTTAGPGTATTAGSPGSTSGGTNRPQRDYPAGGPTDPVFPPGPTQPTYELLVSGDGDCAKLLAETQTWDSVGVPSAEGSSTTPLYMSAAYACLGRWDDALRTYAQINAGSPEFQKCARRELLNWLTPLIDARRQDPNFSPVFVKSSARSPCPPDETSSTSAESSSTTTPSTESTETTTSSIAPTTSTG
jgi:hypothetical protein